MYTKADLDKDISTVIENAGEEQVIDPALVTIEIMRDHRPNCNATDNYFTYGAYHHTRDCVGKKLNQDKKKQNPGQSNMFPLLQERYMVPRDGREMNVPRNQMAYKERIDKIATLRSEGAAKIAHADQLERETNALVASGLLSLDKAI